MTLKKTQFSVDGSGKRTSAVGGDGGALNAGTNNSDDREGSSHFRTSLGSRLFDNQGGLSSGRQKLLRQILDESNETFFLSSREMGRRYNVDSATIIRTVQELGYEKFADFAQDLR